MAFGFWLLISSCLSVAFSYRITTQIVIPKLEHGTRYNAALSTPLVSLEVFLEAHCSDSMAAWLIIKDLQRHYGNSRLEIIVHHMPLPYHRYGFLATQGFFVIRDLDATKATNYLEANMANTANFSIAYTQDMTESQVLEMLANLAYSSTGINQTTFKAGINSWRSYAYTVATWKYAARRGVAGTPWYFVNGVDLGIGAVVPTYSDWRRFLDPVFTY